ncbi:MAG: hypothetical protein ACYDHH_34105 [Solirubrobacteraceae bacterium]
MLSTGSRVGELVTPILTPWAPGPVTDPAGAVVVSVTEFAAHRVRDLPGIWLTGLQLRMGWWAMPGAIGLWLWSVPTSAKGGSVSVWTSQDDLRRFVGLPRHIEVMRRNRERGTVRSTTWTADKFVRADVLHRAREWIAGPVK